MTTKYHVFRMGEIIDGNTPSLNELYDEIEGMGFEGKEMGNRRGIMNTEIDERRGFIYLVYIREYENEYVGLSEDNPEEESVRKSYPRRIMKVIITDNDKVIFESAQGASIESAIDLIYESFDTDIDIDVIEEFDRKDMLRFFEDSLSALTKYKIKEIGEHEPNPIDVTRRARSILETFGEVVKYSENSGGRKDTKDDELSRGMIGLSYPHLLKGEDENGRLRQMRASGRVSIRYNDNEEDEDGVSGEDEAILVMEFIEESLPDILDD